MLKCVTERLVALCALADGLDYHKQRSELTDKLVPAKSEQLKKLSTKMTTTGSGKPEENGTKESTTETTTAESTTKESNPDAASAVAALDVRWFFKTKRVLRACVDALAVTTDQVSKNMDKIERPRGSGGGGGFNMY